ncbi:ninein-like [Cololabis saira]|uniref:ninein-like n=1 Tax=Cololabis saira TaxID=129043 RepID=UPI002AD229FD|nr:ninein-like [Cololabis saira]
MDGGEDEYEERLKELFHSFDGAGRGALDPDELSDLCQSLQLDDAAPVLLQTLLQGRDRLTATVDFNQFKNALILVLSSTAEPAPEEEEEEEEDDEETLQEPGSPEVQPKFVKGSKRYGRRSTPEFMACISGRSDDVNPDDEEDLEDNGDSAVPRKRERWNAHDTSTEEYEAEGQLQLWNPDEPSRGPAVPPPGRVQERLRDACEDLGINWDGCAARSDLLVLCDHLGLEPGVEALSLTDDGVVNVQEFVSSLINQYKPPTPSSSSTPYRQLKRHHSTQPFDEGGRRTSVLCSTIGTRLFSTLDDGSGHSAAESVLDAWMEEGVENSADILQALNFDLDGKLSLSELTAALENELLVTKSGVHRAALASFRAEIRHLLECVDREIREKEKIRSDLEKAEKQKIQLATEVDEHHSAIEHMNNLNLRKLEQEHREKLALVRTELLGELDLIQQQAALQRLELEEEISKIREDETFLRDHLSISVKENRRLEMELLDGAEKLLEAQTHISRLQTSLDDITREKFGELDPGSADFLLQEEKFRQLRAGYEAQCRELQDRIDELQAELRSFTALGRAPDPGPKPLSEELESKSPGTESDPGIGSEEVQPFAMSLEAEMMLEQLKEQHLQEVEDLQHQLESKINEFNEAAEKQQSAHEEQAAAAARQNQREVQALRDDMAGLHSFTQELQSQLEQAELERAELDKSRAEELQDRREEEAARLEEQMAALKAQQAAEMDKLTEEREELQQERAELQNRQEDAAARLLEAHAAELGRMEEQMAALKAQQAAEMDKLTEERAELQQERAELQQEREELQQERAELQNRQEEEAARLLEAHSAELKEEQAAEVEARLAEEREVLQQEREELQQKRAELQNRWEKEAARLLEAHAAELGKMEELKEEQAALVEARLAEEREELQQERAELQNWREEEAARLLEAHAADLGRLEEQMTALKAQRAAEMDKLTEEREELQQERAELQNQREEEATRLLEAHAADPGRMEELRNQQAADERAELQQEREELERRLLADWDRQKKALEENHEEILRARLEEATVRFEQERDGVEAALTERWREEKARLDEQSAETLQLLLEEEMLRLVREQEEKEGGMTECWERERAQLQDRLLGEREQFQRREERLREEWETERLQLEEDYEGMIRDRLEEEREKLRGEREQEERLMEEEREKLRGEREQEERRAERRMEEERERLEEIHRDAVKELRAKHAEERDELAAALDKLRDDISRERREVELSFVLRLREVEERFSSDQDSSAGRFQADVLRLERHYQSELASLSERHAEQTLLWESELATAVAAATEERAGLRRGWEEERAALAGEHAQDVEALRAESRLLQEQLEEAAGTAQRTDIQLSRQLNELHGRLQEQHTLRADAELLLARTVEDFRGERAELLARAEEMEAEREELTGKVEELEAKNAELEAKNTEVVEELEAKNAELEAKNAELEAKNAELVEELAAKNAELEAKNAELEAKNAELEAKNTELEAKRDELTAKVEELEAKNAELEAKNVELDARNDELDARNAELEAKNAELEAKNAELEAKVEELEAKNAELEAKNAELEAKNAELEAKNVELEAKNAELEAKNTELEAKNAELEAKNAELEAKRDELTAKVEELEAKDAELEATDAELEAKRDELLSVSENQVAEGIQQIQAERDDLTAKVSELEVKHAELEELLKQAALDFQLEREELIARASELEANHQELTAKVEELEAKVEELEVKHADLLAGSESRGAEGIRRIQAERDDLAAKVSELEAKNAELEELLKQAALDFQLEREELQENLTAAEAELRDERERGAEREQLRVKVEELRVEVCRLSAPARKPADEADEASDARQDGVEDARDAGGDGDAPDELAEALESRNHDDEPQNPPEGEHGQLREASAAGSRPEEAGNPGQRPADDAEANTREETECEGLLGVRASHAAAAAEEKLLLQQKISLLQQKTEILENLLAHHGDRVSAGRRALEENYGLKVQMLLLMEQLRQLEAAALASACENARLQEQNGDLERRVRSLEGGGDVVYGDEDGPAVLAGEVRRMRAENAELLRLLGEVERQDETPDGGETPVEAEAFLDLEEEDEDEEEEEDKPLQESCRRSERRNGELRRALAALQDRSQALDQTTRAQRSETSRLAEENGVLRQKISALKDGDLRDVQEELIQTLEHLKKEKFAAQKAEDHFKKQISELRSQSRQLQDENGLLVERQAENAADSDGLRRRLAALATEELPPEDESETAACVLALEAELTRSLEDAARLQTRNELLSRQLSDLGEKVKTAEESLQAVGRQSSRLRTDLRVLQQERDALKQEVAALQKQLQNANDKNQMLELALHSGGLQNQSQNKKLLREERSRLLEQTLLRQENERLQAEVRGVRADLLQAREKVRQLDAALLKHKQPGQRSLVRALEQENQALKQELQELQAQQDQTQLESLQQENEALKAQMARLSSQVLETFQAQLVGLLPPSPHRVPRHRGDDPDNGQQEDRERKMRLMEERMREIELSLHNVKLLLREKVSQLKEQLHKNGKADVLIQDLYVENTQLLRTLQVTEQRQSLAEKKNYLLEEKISSLNKIVRDLNPSHLNSPPYGYKSP